jgi:adenosylcobinamide kinase/adenosylcobinamide-phosphate guanylyltransferase
MTSAFDHAGGGSGRSAIGAYRSALILGGARSGKSRFAQGMVEMAAEERVFVATAQAFDDEMSERIARHRTDRDGSWRTHETSLELAEAIESEVAPARAVLVDCLTLWLSNLMLAGREPENETDRLLAAIAAARGPLVLVSNEVGQGIVPATVLGRTFRDAQGRLNQRIARVADAVVMVTAGCPTLLKPHPPFDLKLA